MSRTVTALYDTRAEAEAACERLTSEVDVAGRAQVIDNNSVEGEQSSTFSTLPLSPEDRPAFSEGIRRGGFMLCAEVDGDEDADRIVSILEQTSSVDLDERQKLWRDDGWQSEPQSEQTEGEPISLDDLLHVGKRDVGRGGPKVRSYVREPSSM